MGLLVFQNLEMGIPYTLLKSRSPEITKKLPVSVPFFYSNTNYKVTFETENIQLHCARQYFNKEA